MIIHHKNIREVSLGKKNLLKYSDEFSFIPLKIFYENSFRECLFQTPKLFLPYGKQKLNNGKYIIDLSFQNKENDEDNNNFLEILKKIYNTIKEKYKDYNVNSFLKKTDFDYTMRLKVSLNSRFYDNSKNHLYKIDPFSYGIFIIGLEGLWIHNDEIWFQWYLLQGRLEKPTFLNEYAFIDDEKDVTDKYQRMKNMGVPEGAIELQKNLDLNRGKTSIPPPPPPLPPSNFRSSIPVNKIKASDLQNVVLKKSEPIKKEKKYSKTGFEPPSLEELQITLSKLKKVI
jgi:hypothetical protein